MFNSVLVVKPKYCLFLQVHNFKKAYRIASPEAYIELCSFPVIFRNNMLQENYLFAIYSYLCFPNLLSFLDVLSQVADELLEQAEEAAKVALEEIDSY